MDQQHGLLVPDLNSLHFYLWRRLRSIVYVTEVNNVQNVQQLVQNESEIICTTPGIFQRVKHCSGTQHP